MTDQPTPLSDEDLSSAIDGEASDDVRARIDASPEAQARLAELRAAGDRLSAATVDPLSDDQVDGLITAALDAPVAPASAGSGARRGPAPWLVAAAVAVLMALGLTLIWSGRGTSDDQASSSPSTPEEVAAEGAAAADQADSSFETSLDHSTQTGSSERTVDDGAATTIAPSTSPSLGAVAPVYLGEFDSGDDIRDALATSFGAASSTTSNDEAFEFDTTVPDDAAIDRCAELLQITLSLEGAPLQTGYATVAGEPVLAYEFAATSSTDGSETTLVGVVGVDACEQVVIFER